MDEQTIKEIVKKMFSSGELQVGINVRESAKDQLRITVYVSDSEDEILQSASTFVSKP
jgi:hypothetical protein